MKRVGPENLRQAGPGPNPETGREAHNAVTPPVRARQGRRYIELACACLAVTAQSEGEGDSQGGSRLACHGFPRESIRFYRHDLGTQVALRYSRNNRRSAYSHITKRKISKSRVYYLDQKKAHSTPPLGVPGHRGAGACILYLQRFN